MLNAVCGSLITMALAGMTALYLALTGGLPKATPTPPAPTPPAASTELSPQRREALERARKEVLRPLPREEGGPSTAKEFQSDIARLDAVVASALKELNDALDGLQRDKAGWASMDLTIEAAKKANAALLVRCDEIIALYEKQLQPTYQSLRQRLTQAPKVLRALAEEKRALIVPGLSDGELMNFNAMVETAKGYATECERRLEEDFSPGSAEVDPGHALGIAMLVDDVRRMRKVHFHWTDVLDACPTAMADGQVKKLMADINKYSMDVKTYSKGVTAMAAAIKARAERGGGR